MVWAEMKKAASYRVDICLNKEAVTQEAQCEGGAGQGPTAHCKHVSAVIYGLACFCKSGSILTELTCTQVLQTFHASQAFKGSPLKSDELQAVRNKEHSLVYDPRPTHLRNTPGIQSRFRNTCLNYSYQNKEERPMPVLQLVPPANLYGVARDHDYLVLSPEDQFLKDNLVTEITGAQVVAIEESTRGQGTSKTWRETRQYRLTSSNFGTICKSTDRRDKTKLAEQLTTHRELRTAAILHGQKYERVAVEKFEEQSHLKTLECGLFVCEKFPQLAASPDGLIGDDAVLEVKCPFASRDQMISPTTVPYLTRDDDGTVSLDKKHNYYFQVQGQFLCIGRSLTYFVVYTLKDLKVVRIERDESFLKDMVEKLMSYYRSHFKEALLGKHFYKDYYQYQL